MRTRVGEIIGPLVGPLGEAAAEAGLEFESDISEAAAGAHVSVRAGSVERIISNLIENACRYAAIGDSPRVVLRAIVDGRMVRIRVADSGPGVAMRERERIFTDFYRGEAAADSHRGIGLGLSCGPFLLSKHRYSNYGTTGRRHIHSSADTSLSISRANIK